jgi:hypothetical protein
MFRLFGWALAALVLTSSDAAAQSLTFARDDYASYAGARAVAAADFDRSGLPDLAVANTGRNSVTILLNGGDGTLTRTFDVAVGTGPFDLAAGDFNRDGIADLAVANADSHSISILLGNGKGSFTRADIPAPSQNPRGITVADVNNDGKQDLIYSGYETRLVQVLIGTGSGTFTKGASYISAVANPQGIDTADFNHDGLLDVAVAYAGTGGLRILYGNGGTAFSGKTIVGDTYLNVVAAGDFNADGWADVAAASTSGSTVGIYLGSAAGMVHVATYPTGASPRGITIGDVNDDGAPDLITANRSSSTVSILLGDRARPGRFLPHIEVGAGTGARDVVAADFDADGRLDLATGNEYASTATVLSNQTSFVRAAYAFKRVDVGSSDQGLSGAQDAWPADFNRDGKLDLATMGATGDTVLVLMTGSTAVQLPGTGQVLRLAVGDFNADGNADVLAARSSGGVTIEVYLGNGRGGFKAAVATPLPWAYGNETLALGDLNRDGRPDLVCIDFDRAAGAYMLELMLGAGDGTFQASPRMLLPDQPEDLTIADINRDGKLDVVLTLSGYGRGVAASVNVWAGDGAGGLAAAPLTVPLSAMYGVNTAVGDVNQDGYPDIVTTSTSFFGVIFGGSAGLSAPVYTDVTNGERYLGALALGDLNVDGHMDVALGSGDLFFGNGDGTFSAGGRFDFGGDIVRIADFTADGLPDIISAQTYGDARVIANRRTEVNQPPTVNAGPDQTFGYGKTLGEDCEVNSTAAASDPDAHFLTYEWRSGSTIVSTRPTVYFRGPLPGSYVYSVTVRDGRGGVTTDSMTVTILPVKEIVLWAADPLTYVADPWAFVDDPTAAGGARAHAPNLGAPKVTSPLAEPQGYVSFSFAADPTQTYKLWIRLKGDANSWANDSVWVQFSHSTDLTGTPKYQTGTESALAVSLEECSGCGVSGWGWEDDGWGAVNKNGILLRFPEAQNPDRDRQEIRIQTREDGVSIDQVVLSAEKYLTTRPGAAKNDVTILPATPPR